MIRVIRQENPNFDPDPGYVRTKVGNWWVDHDGDPPTAEEVRRMMEPTQAEIESDKTAKEKAIADEFVTSTEPAARANRAMARVTMQSVQRVIDKVNECVAFCNSKGASITPLTKSNWSQLLAATKAMNAAETNAVQ